MKPLIVALSFIGCGVLIVGAWGALKPAASVATFDMQRVQGQFIHQLALHQASREVVNTSSASFKRKLQQVLDSYAHEKEVVILDGRQVLSSGRDVTDSIIKRLAAAMRGQS